ncbi:SGNH/GDSL hydrolase family protein [Geodermatophilus sp. SYSU D00703]
MFPRAATARRWLPLLVVCTVLSACGAGAPPVVAPSATTPPPPPTRAVFLGDSYTVGVGGGGYATAVADALGWTPVLEAESGTGYLAEGLAPELSPYGARLAPVVAHAPAVVVVQGSTNDVGLPVDQVRSAAQALYQQLATAMPDADVLVVGPLAAPGVDPGGLEAVRAVLAQTTAEAGLPFIDPVAEGWLQPPQGLFADLLHPNDAGYRLMADRLVTALRQRGY